MAAKSPPALQGVVESFLSVNGGRPNDLQQIGSAPKPATIPQDFSGFITIGGFPRPVDTRTEQTSRKVIVEATEAMAKVNAEKKKVLDKATLAELEFRNFRREETYGLHRASNGQELAVANDLLRLWGETKQRETQEFDRELARLSLVIDKAERRLEAIKAEAAEKLVLERMRQEVGPLA